MTDVAAGFKLRQVQHTDHFNSDTNEIKVFTGNLFSIIITQSVELFKIILQILYLQFDS